MMATTKTKKLNFYATYEHYFDHMLPIWEQLPKKYRGTFYLNQRVANKAKRLKVEHKVGFPESDDLVLVASYGDFTHTKGDVVYMEHGIGHTYSNDHSGFAGGKHKERVVLFLNQHHITQEKNTLANPLAKNVIIGTPKMDKWDKMPMFQGEKPIVCVSFHWDNKVAPEARTAFPFYSRVLPVLETQKDFELVYHGHPKEDWTKVFKNKEIRFLKSQEEVFTQADIYICDNSSSMYEFLVTGKPVIYLNCKWYRKDVKHGIRFWDYIAGLQIDQPFKLLQGVLDTIKNPDKFAIKREQVVKELYPFHGRATEVAVKEITNFLDTYGRI